MGNKNRLPGRPDTLESSSAKHHFQKIVEFIAHAELQNTSLSMPDAFFSAPKQKKRKRTDSASNGTPKKFARPPARDANARKQGKGSIPDKGKGKRGRDEELSDQTDDDGNIDDMDLRVDEEEADSGEEDENETPAEKRLRLAQLYLESVKVGLGAYPIFFISNKYWRLSVCSGWRIRRGGDRQGAYICTAKTRCPRALGQSSPLRRRLRTLLPSVHIRALTHILVRLFSRARGRSTYTRAPLLRDERRRRRVRRAPLHRGQGGPHHQVGPAHRA